MAKEFRRGKKSSEIGVVFVLLAVLFWGISFISTKVLLQEYPPVSIAFFRQFIALFPLAGLFLVKKAYFKLRIITVFHMVVGSLFGVVLYFVFENTGMKYISASGASIIVATIPIFTLLIDTLISRKKLALRTLFLILCSWVGVYLVISADGQPEGGADTLKGSLLVFCAMVSWIIYTMVTKRLSTQYSSLQMTSVQTLLSIPLFIPFVWRERFFWHWPSGNAAVHFMFLGIFCSALAYVFFLYGISVLGPALSSSYLNLIPLVTIATGTVFLGERLAPLQYIGAFLILTSLGLISFFKLKRRRPVRIEAVLPEVQEKTGI